MENIDQDELRNCPIPYHVLCLVGRSCRLGRSRRFHEFERISRTVGVQGRYRACRAAREE